MKVEIIFDAKCKHCKWFDYYYKGKRKVHKCNLTEKQLTLKSSICEKFELWKKNVNNIYVFGGQTKKNTRL